MQAYMHTIDGKPAFFDGRQICYMVFYGKASPLAQSLKQIRTEQKASAEWRMGQGFQSHIEKYGHLRVAVTDI